MKPLFEDIFIPSADGLRLHARVYGDAYRGKAPVVCLPGLTRNAQDFHDLAVLLSDEEHRRRVIVIDYRGRGGSAYDSDWLHYTVPVEAVDVRQMLKALGVFEACIVGTSRGGLITMALAVTQPILIKACVLNDIGPVIEAKGLERIASYVGKGSLPKNWDEAVLKLKASNADFTDLAEAEWRDFAEIVFQETAEGWQLRYDAALGNTLLGLDFSKPLPTAWSLFEALRAVPVLVLRGENSDLLSEETLNEMAARHGGMESLRVPNEGHAPFLGREVTASVIADFLGRVG
jgi:pimeloyl-ACP methyl ester carboxylesterase